MSRCAPGCQRPPRSCASVLAHVVPDLLGVDQQAVHVEDDGGDHSAQYRAVHVDERRRSPGRARGRRTSPTKSVWSPAAHLVDRAHAQPADRVRDQPRVVLAHRDAVPEHERRHAAREVLGEPVLLAGRGSTPSTPPPPAAPRRARRRARARSRRAAGRARARSSDETVSPARRPPDSATTTETPAGQRRNSSRCSRPRSRGSSSSTRVEATEALRKARATELRWLARAVLPGVERPRAALDPVPSSDGRACRSAAAIARSSVCVGRLVVRRRAARPPTSRRASRRGPGSWRGTSRPCRPDASRAG